MFFDAVPVRVKHSAGCPSAACKTPDKTVLIQHNSDTPRLLSPPVQLGLANHRTQPRFPKLTLSPANPSGWHQKVFLGFKDWPPHGLSFAAVHGSDPWLLAASASGSATAGRLRTRRPTGPTSSGSKSLAA